MKVVRVFMRGMNCMVFFKAQSSKLNRHEKAQNLYPLSPC